MCGGEPSIRIERADNGYLIDAYLPGNGDKPGNHKRMVAASPEQALKLVQPHLSGMGKKKGPVPMRVRGGRDGRPGRVVIGGKKKQGKRGMKRS